MKNYKKSFTEITRNERDFKTIGKHHDLIKELVERATPKKVLNLNFIKDNNLVGNCPACNGEITDSSSFAEYCEDCGQALKWRDKL